MSGKGTNTKRKRGRPRLPKNYKRVRRKVANRAFENAFAHMPVEDATEPRAITSPEPKRPDEQELRLFTAWWLIDVN